MRLLQLSQPLRRMQGRKRSYMVDATERAAALGRTQINRRRLEIPARLHVFGASHQHIRHLLHHPAPFCPGIPVQRGLPEHLRPVLCSERETLFMQVCDYEEKDCREMKSVGKRQDV